MKPMLAHIYEPRHWSDSTPIYVQPKLNGVRALYQNGHFQSRDELPWNDKVLVHLIEPLKKMFPEENVILDGELYVHGWPLQRINGAVQIARSEPREDTHEVQYWVFDTVNYQKEFVLRYGHVSERLRVLQHPLLHPVTTLLASRETAELFYTMSVSDGFEGIMYRIGLCPYTWPSMGRKISDKNNRTWHLLKRKDWQDDEFICLEVQEGEGKRSGMVGAFICGTKTGATFGVGSGLSDAEAQHYLDNPPIGRKIKVKFLTYTNDGIPFNPTVEAVL